MDKVLHCPVLVVKRLQDALWECWNQVSESPDLQQTTSKTLQEALFGCLLDGYIDALSVLKDDNLFLSFCMLPLKAIELWGSSDQYKTDSENTVVVLLNKWWHSQKKQIQTDDCKKQLSALVRLFHLSNGYLLYALDKLDWFVAPFPMYKHPCSVVNKYGIDKVDMTSDPYDKIVMARRLSSSDTQLEVRWPIPLERIQKAVSSTTDRCVPGPKAYWQGHCWELYFEAMDSQKGNEYVELNVCIQLLPAAAMPDKLPASADICIVGNPFGDIWNQVMFDEMVWYSYDVKVQELSSELQQYLTDDKHLVINVTVKNVE